MDESLLCKAYTHPRDRIRELKLGSTGARASFYLTHYLSRSLPPPTQEECRQHCLGCLTTKNCSRSGKHWLQDAPPAVGRKVVNHPLGAESNWTTPHSLVSSRGAVRIYQLGMCPDEAMLVEEASGCQSKTGEGQKVSCDSRGVGVQLRAT